jgi:hypothetical protein
MECKHHELFDTNEEWISDGVVSVVMECSLCQKNFKGVLKEDDKEM